MKTIFWGLLITWFHFNLEIGAASIELLPSAVGWYLVLQNVRELPPCSAQAALEGPLKVMIGLSAVTWCTKLVGGLGILGNALALMETFAHVYALYLLIELVAAIEMMISHAMPVAALRNYYKTWSVSIILSAIFGAAMLLPLFATVAALITGICALIAFVASICLVVQFWNAAKAYEEAMAHPIEILPPEE